MGLFSFVYSTPLLYDPDALAENFPAHAAGYMVALAGATVVMQVLKRRLVRAEDPPLPDGRDDSRQLALHALEGGPTAS